MGVAMIICWYGVETSDKKWMSLTQVGHDDPLRGKYQIWSYVTKSGEEYRPSLVKI